MKKINKNTLILILALLSLNVLGQNSISFTAIVNSEIKSIEDEYVTFKIVNKSKNALLIPSILKIDNFLYKGPDLDIGVETYFFDANEYKLIDSCFILSQPIIPEEGILIRKYKKGVEFMYTSSLPMACVFMKGKYKIRFSFVGKFDNGRTKRVVSGWHYFLKL